MTTNDNPQPNPLDNLPECRAVMQGTETELAAGPAGLVAMIRFYQYGNKDRGLHTASLPLHVVEGLRDDLNDILEQAAELLKDA